MTVRHVRSHPSHRAFEVHWFLRPADIIPPRPPAAQRDSAGAHSWPPQNMALRSFTIVSRYTPQQREPISQPISPEDDLWQTERAFGAQRLHSRPAPSFVAATLEYDEYGRPKSVVDAQPEASEACNAGDDVGAWYRTLTSIGKVRQVDMPVALGESSTTVSPKALLDSSSVESSRCPSTSSSPPPASRALYTHNNAKPNWFTSTPPPRNASASGPSSLADLLSRYPPPLPSESAFKPPVFLALGPGNKGFAMLERKGWQEGEGLGSARIEGKSREGLGMNRKVEKTLRWEFDAEERKPSLQSRGPHGGWGDIVSTGDTLRQVIDLTLSDSEQDTTPEVVDLTISDSDSEPEVDVAIERADDSPPSEAQPHGMTLLTPIATTLKADRLGIGLKPARPHSSNRVRAKAVTHTSAAIAAHIRTANQVCKEKAKHGRGSRGFARSKRKEERERLGMLAYMNS